MRSRPQRFPENTLSPSRPPDTFESEPSNPASGARRRAAASPARGPAKTGATRSRLPLTSSLVCLFVYIYLSFPPLTFRVCPRLTGPEVRSATVPLGRRPGPSPLPRVPPLTSLGPPPLRRPGGCPEAGRLRAEDGSAASAELPRPSRQERRVLKNLPGSRGLPRTRRMQAPNMFRGLGH